MKKPKRLIKIFAITLASALGVAVLGIAGIFVFFECVCPVVNTPLGEYASGDGKHTVFVYLSNGGATTPFSILCDVKGEHIFGKRRIYVKDHIDSATVEWIDERTVCINGVTLDIFDDKYTDPGY